MATISTSTAAKAWRPDSTGFAPIDAVPDALLLSMSTVAGSVEGDSPVMRVPFVDDAAAQFTAEGSTIDESSPALSEVAVSTGKVSQLVRLSNEQFRQVGTPEQLAASVRRAITRKADSAFVAGVHPASGTQLVTINGAPTGGTFTLSSVTGAATAPIAYNAASSAVQTAIQGLGGGYSAAAVTGGAGGPFTITATPAPGLLTADASALTGGTSPSVSVTPTGSGSTPPAGVMQTPGVLVGGQVATNLDAIADLIAVLESNGATPSAVIADPVAWARLRKLKTATGSAVSLIGSGTEDAERRLLSLPVTVSAAMPTGTGLVIDRSSVVSAVGAVQIAVDESVFFASDSVAVRATWRIGWGVVRPSRIGLFSVAP